MITAATDVIIDNGTLGDDDIIYFKGIFFFLLGRILLTRPFSQAANPRHSANLQKSTVVSSHGIFGSRTRMTVC